MIQLVGAITLLGKNTSNKSNGLHIYTAGVAIQQAVILGFVLLVVVFQRRLKRESGSTIAGRAAKLLYVLYASLVLITVRSPALSIYQDIWSSERQNLLSSMCQTMKPLVAIFMADLSVIVQIRIIFRIIEFSAGADSSLSKNISNHEAYMYCFDALPMFLALLTFHLWHPGKVLVGPESEFEKRTQAETEVIEEEMK